MSDPEQSTDRQKAGEPSATQDDNEISMLDLAIVLVQRKKLIFGLPLIVGIIAAVIALLLPNIYTATTRILPPQQGASSTSALLSQLSGALGGLAGGAASIKSPNDLYVGMLKSRTVADNLIARFDLNNRYEQKFQSDTRKLLESNTRITAGKDGLITIETENRDSQHAAELANAYVDELSKLTNVLAVTEASQRRLFFERQLAQAKDNLTMAENAARQDLENGGLSNVDSQGRAMVEVTARLRGQISAKEVQIGAMRSFAAERNPELQRSQDELQTLKRELVSIEGGYSTGRRNPPNNPGNSGLENLGRLRDLRYYETIYELLAKQYELAKVDEAKDSSLVQVIDKAIEPDRKSKPRRTVIVLLSMFVAALIAVLWALATDALGRSMKDAKKAERLLYLRAMMHIGKRT